ncbi:hypothetical protein SKAU_G00243870 [Synaphobranchus kaupii]|uniref:Uncharacterized protein n=1 Tax=Synaphobranchus kaupii TaxID=118154 RepID=A0A9Q1F8J5_SYNKA|nr:hypothetical protein SKAU_G00243870 [Synaphobranchus kaupii]
MRPIVCLPACHRSAETSRACRYGDERSREPLRRAVRPSLRRAVPSLSGTLATQSRGVRRDNGVCAAAGRSQHFGHGERFRGRRGGNGSLRRRMCVAPPNELPLAWPAGPDDSTVNIYTLAPQTAPPPSAWLSQQLSKPGSERTEGLWPKKEMANDGAKDLGRDGAEGALLSRTISRLAGKTVGRQHVLGGARRRAPVFFWHPFTRREEPSQHLPITPAMATEWHRHGYTGGPLGTARTKLCGNGHGEDCQC